MNGANRFTKQLKMECHKNQTEIRLNSHHACCVHDSVSERVRVVPADAIDGPVGGLKVGHVRAPHSQVLDVPPVQFGVNPEAEGNDSGGKGRAGGRARMRRCAHVVQVGRHHLPLARRARAVGCGQGRGAGLGVPGDVAKVVLN
jgi:hypothetical protein